MGIIVNNGEFTIDQFIPKAKSLVAQYTNGRLDNTDDIRINDEEVFVVWFSKTLQNAKALLSTHLPDGMYYEVTYNGDKNEFYFDAYKKWHNEKVEMAGVKGRVVNGVYYTAR